MGGRWEVSFPITNMQNLRTWYDVGGYDVVDGRRAGSATATNTLLIFKQHM